MGEKGELMTVLQAARELGRSAERVRQWARAERIPVVMTPYGRLFRREDVEAFKAERELLKSAVA